MDSIYAVLSGILLLLFFSSFVKCATVFGALRYGLGLHGAGFGLVMLALAFLLSVFTLGGNFSENEQKQVLMLQGDTLGDKELFSRFEPFLEKHAREDLVDRFSALHTKLSKKTKAEAMQNERQSIVLILAFVITELQEAFQIVFVILLPFIVIDLIVVNIFQLLAIRDYSPFVLALPLKVLLFYSVDGFSLITEKLIGGYAL